MSHSLVILKTLCQSTVLSKEVSTFIAFNFCLEDPNKKFIPTQNFVQGEGSEADPSDVGQVMTKLTKQEEY